MKDVDAARSDEASSRDRAPSTSSGDGELGAMTFSSNLRRQFAKQVGATTRKLSIYAAGATLAFGGMRVEEAAANSNAAQGVVSFVSASVLATESTKREEGPTETGESLESAPAGRLEKEPDERDAKQSKTVAESKESANAPADQEPDPKPHSCDDTARLVETQEKLEACSTQSARYIEKTGEDHARLQAEIEQAKQELEERGREVQQLRVQMESLQQLRDSLLHEQRELKDQTEVIPELSVEAAKVKPLEQELRELRDDREGLRKQNRDLSRGNRTLSSELTDLQRKAAEAERVEPLQRQLGELERQRAALEVSVKDMAGKAELRERDITLLDQRVVELQNRVQGYVAQQLEHIAARQRLLDEKLALQSQLNGWRAVKQEKHSVFPFHPVSARQVVSAATNILRSRSVPAHVFDDYVGDFAVWCHYNEENLSRSADQWSWDTMEVMTSHYLVATRVTPGGSRLKYYSPDLKEYKELVTVKEEELGTGLYKRTYPMRDSANTRQKHRSWMIGRRP